MGMKKIIGLILFMVFLIVTLGYTSIMDAYAVRKAKSLIEEGDFYEAYELLRDKEFSSESDGYLYTLICEYELEHHILFNRRLDQLVLDRNVVILQKLVDWLGVKIDAKLLPIYEMGGLFFDVEVSYHIANLYYGEYEKSGQLSYLNLAMDIRGHREEIDKIYLAYYFNKGEIDRLVNKYKKLPENLQEEFILLLTEQLVSGKLNSEILQSNRISEVPNYLDYVWNLGLPKELADRIGIDIYNSLTYFYLNSGTEGLESILRHPFLANNTSIALTN